MFAAIEGLVLKVPSFFQSKKGIIAANQFKKLSCLGLGLTKWGIPLAIAGAWIAYPAIHDEFKIKMGLK